MRAPASRARGATKTPRGGLLFMLGVIGPIIGLVIAAIFTNPHLFLSQQIGAPFDLLVWVGVVAVVELLPVPLTGVLRFSLSFPVLLGVAMIYDPIVAATIALVGSFDTREIHREITPLKALFNRCQIALSTLVESAIFHALASIHSPLRVLIPTVILATAANYFVNVGLVTLAMRLIYGVPILKTFNQLRVGGLREFIVNYVGLGFVGLIIAVLFAKVALWSVPVFLLPLAFARQMFFRSLALEEASKELKDREQVLRALSNRMAEERQDERMQIAAYLHDDLAQMIFRLTLQLEMAKKRLGQGDLTAVNRDLDNITDIKQQTSDAIRALIRDLHRSPIGRKGLAEAIQSFAEDISKGHPTMIDTDVVEVSLPPPIQLLIYQIVREAAMNALKHAEADHIWVTLSEKDDGVALEIRDDGRGFDTAAPPPEGHFGSVMMKERALVAGGTYDLESRLGEGTTIIATFPRVWVEEGSLHEASAQLHAEGTRHRETQPPRGATTGPSAPVVGVRGLTREAEDADREQAPDEAAPDGFTTDPEEGRAASA